MNLLHKNKLLKTAVFSIGLCLNGIGSIGMTKAMDTHAHQNEIIKDLLINHITNAFRNGNYEFEGTDDGKGIGFAGGGFIYFPKNLNTKADFLNFVNELKVPREKMALDTYFQLSGEKSLMVGSGLVQSTLQPIGYPDFENAYFIDNDEICYPDITSEFNLNLIYQTDLEKYQGQFDAIYLDNFHGMYDESVLQAASLMLKQGGKIMMTYRPHQVSMDDNVKELMLSISMCERSDIIRDIETSMIFNLLTNAGFKDPISLNDKTKIRPYGFAYHHIIAYKK